MEKEASWVERFTSRTGPVEPPPITSTHGFTSHQGVIYKVPQGSIAFKTHEYTRIGVTYNSLGTEHREFETTPSLWLEAPQFSTNISTLNLLQGSTGSVFLIAQIPSSSQRLKWVLTSKPDWLDVSPTQGSQSTYLEVRDNGQAAVGNIGYIELQTDPAYGAPSLESGPLRVKIQVVPGIASQGVLLAGGRDPYGQVLNTAEVWDPGTKKSVSTYPMFTPREDHTGTRLLDGRILVAGGRVHTDVLARAELFDRLRPPLRRPERCMSRDTIKPPRCSPADRWRARF